MTLFNVHATRTTPATAACIPSSVLWLNRLALFLIFFWFGFLKIIDVSPAESLIVTLHAATFVHVIPIHIFLGALGFAECLIGLLWLFPSLTRYTLCLFLAQMITTFLPLFILPDLTWTRSFVLSLSGQYILKNIVLVASAFTLYTDCRLRQWRKKS